MISAPDHLRVVLRALFLTISAALLLTASSAFCQTQTTPLDTALEIPAPPATPTDAILNGDYLDALALIDQQPAPRDLPTSLERAELLLMAGYSQEAAAEFRRVRELTPPDEPISDYGDALCSLLARDKPAAAASIRLCIASPTYAAHRQAIDLLTAALNASAAPLQPPVLPGSDAPAQSLLIQELNALAQLSKSASAASNLASSPWMLPGGVPRVTEPFGLRPVALVASAAGAAAGKLAWIAAPIAGSDPAAQIRSALLPSSYPAAGAPLAKSVSGRITLEPPPGVQAPQGALATFLVDGNVIAIINSNSLAYTWDTRHVQNGRHTVQIQIGSVAGHSGTQTYTRYYEVDNAAHTPQSFTSDSAPRPATLTATDRDAVTAAWTILELQPDYAYGERALAAQAARQGNQNASLYHAASAEAIAFDNNPQFLKQLTLRFGNRLPLLYANQDRTRSHPEPTTFGIWRGAPAIREIALTFDDGPSPTATAPLLDALQSSNAPGTFFVVGTRAQLFPDLVRRMHSQGEEVEDHSFTHPNLDEATPNHVYEEILRNAVVVQSLTGTWPHFLRPPGGQSNPTVLRDAGRCGLTGAFWTLDALSAEYTGSPDAVTRFVMKRVKPGAVILMHNGPYATYKAIPGLVRDLRSQGYTLVTLQKLAQDAAKT